MAGRVLPAEDRRVGQSLLRSWRLSEPEPVVHARAQGVSSVSRLRTRSKNPGLAQRRPGAIFRDEFLYGLGVSRRPGESQQACDGANPDPRREGASAEADRAVDAERVLR